MTIAAIRMVSVEGQVIPIEVIQLESGNYAMVFSNAEEAVVDLAVAGTLDVAGVATLSGAVVVDDTLHVSGNATLDAALDHNGTTVGFYGVAPATRTTGIAQLTNSTGQVGNNTVALVADAVAASVDTSAASLASVNTSIATVNADLADLTDKLNVVMTALKSLGIIGV